MAEVNKVLITSENLKRFGTNVKMFVNGIKTELATNVSTAQTTADKGVKDAANAASAAAGALAEAKKKIAAGSLAKINGKSLENGGNLSLADIGIDGEIFKVVTARPDLNNAVYNKVYLEPVTGAPTGNVYKEWIKVNDGTADKWEELGEWKADITVDAALSDSSTNPVQNKAVKKRIDEVDGSVTDVKNMLGEAKEDLAAQINNKVDKVSGKGLSTNDYTTDEKNKLSGIAAGANKTVVDSALNANSTNPVQNKVINTALAGKASTAVASQTANGLFSAADKKKLDGIAEGANKITVDAALSESSVNPVQNMAVQKALTAQASVLNATKNTAEDAYNGVESIAKGYVKYSSVVQLVDISDTDIDALWTSAPDSKS